MKTIKALSALTAVFIASGLVAGCGSPTQSSASSKQQTITFWEPDAANWQPLYKQLVSNFEKENPSIKVNLVNIPQSGFLQKLNTSFSSGQGPDVWAWFYNTSEFQKGYIQDLSSYIKKDNYNMNQFFQPITSERGTGTNGDYYALPRDISVDTVFYNKTLFDKYHVPYPKAGWTLADYQKIAKELTHTQNKDYGTNEPSSDWWLTGYPYVWDLGGDVVSKDGWTAKGNLDSPQAVQVVQDAQNMEKDGSVMPNDLAQTFGNGDNAAFLSGHLGMAQGTLWGIGTLKNANFKWGVAELPVPTGATKHYSWQDTVMYYMNAHSKSKDAAWKFMEYMSGSKAGQIVLKDKSWIPDNKQAWIAAGMDKSPEFAPFWKEAQYPTLTPDYERSPGWYTVVDPIISAEWNKMVTPAAGKPYESVQQGMKTIAQKAQQALNREKAQGSN